MSSLSNVTSVTSVTSVSDLKSTFIAKNVRPTKKMDLHIQNFKSISDKKIRLNHGMTLIMGTSGAGKSSLIEAIVFAITGKPRKCKPIGTNKKTSVALTISNRDLKIVRTARSSSLIVTRSGNEYLDDAAEGVLRQEFGNFESCCYIPQDTSTAFVNLSATSKLTMLEDRVFGERSTVLKNAVKARSKALGEKELLLKGEFNARQKTLEKWDEIPSDPGKPPSDRTLQSLKKESETVLKRVENNRLKKTQALRMEQERESMNARVSNGVNKIKQEQAQIQKLRSRIPSNAKEILMYVEWADKNKEIEKIQTQLADAKKIYETSLREHVKRTEMEKREIKSQLWTRWNKVDIDLEMSQAEASLDSAKIVQRLFRLHDIDMDLTTNGNAGEEHVVERIEQINSDIVQSERNFSSRKQEQINEISELEKAMCSYFECPSCADTLRWNEMTQEAVVATKKEYENRSDRERSKRRIVRVKNQMKSDDMSHAEEMAAFAKTKDILLEIRNHIMAHEFELNVSDLKQYTEGMQSYKDSNLNLEKRLAALNRNTIPPAIRAMERAKNKTEESLKSATTSSVDRPRKPRDVDNVDLRSLSETIKISMMEIDVRSKAIENVQRESENITTSFGRRWTVAQSINIETVLEELENDEARIRELNVLIDATRKWKALSVEHARYQDDTNCLDDVKARTTAIANKLSTLSSLKTLIQKAESVALLSTLDTINAHALEYLEAFFPEESIVATLESFSQAKTSKKIKPSINISINHKGEEMPYACLSGGEKIRIVTAFNLALGELEPSPIILLDEVTANLDVELTEDILDFIKKNTEGKIVIVIAHQCITGLFDNVMEFQ